MTITETLILSLRSARSTSIPPILGISRSSNIKSGTSFRIKVRACSPLPAVATSHSSGRSLTCKRRREAASSSTISTRAPLVCIFISYWSIHHRDTESLRGPNRTFGFAAVRPQRLRGELSLSSIFDLRLVAKSRSDFLDEDTFVDGLGDVADAAGSQRLLPITFHRIRGHSNYGNISCSRLCLYFSGDFKPVHS